jgi:hypothetical protein
MSCAITVYVGIRMKTRGAGKWQPSTPSCGRGPVHSWPRVTLVQPTPQPSALGVGVPHERATNPPCSRRTTSSSRVAARVQAVYAVDVHSLVGSYQQLSSHSVPHPPVLGQRRSASTAISTGHHCKSSHSHLPCSTHTSPTPTPPDCSIVTHRLSLESELQNFKTI